MSEEPEVVEGFGERKDEREPEVGKGCDSERKDEQEEPNVVKGFGGRKVEQTKIKMGEGGSKTEIEQNTQNEEKTCEKSNRRSRGIVRIEKEAMKRWREDNRGEEGSLRIWRGWWKKMNEEEEKENGEGRCFWRNGGRDPPGLMGGWKK